MRLTVFSLVLTAVAAGQASTQGPALHLPASHSPAVEAQAAPAPEGLGPRRAARPDAEVALPQLEPIGIPSRAENRSSRGRRVLYGAAVGAGVGLVTGLLLDEGGYSAGGEDDEEGGSTVWVMIPLGAAVGALVGAIL